jgi:hypothetical protein
VRVGVHPAPEGLLGLRELREGAPLPARHHGVGKHRGGLVVAPRLPQRHAFLHEGVDVDGRRLGPRRRRTQRQRQ